MGQVLPLINGRDVKDHEWKYDWVSEVLLASFLPHLLFCKSSRVVVVVGSCDGTDVTGKLGLL